MVEFQLYYDKLFYDQRKLDTIIGVGARWEEANKAIVDQMLTYNNGSWVSKFNEQENSVIADFLNLMEQMRYTRDVFEDALGQLMSMLNRCGCFYYTLDGYLPLEKYSSDREVTSILHWAMYDSDGHDAIINGCEAVLTDTQSEVDTIGELNEILGALEYVDASTIQEASNEVKEGLKKQAYIGNFEESFSYYVQEVADFNTSISSQLASVVDGTEDMPEFTRNTDYDKVLEEVRRDKVRAWITSWYKLRDSNNAGGESTWSNTNDPEYDEYMYAIYQAYCNAPPEEKALFDKYINDLYIATCKAKSYGKSNASSYFQPWDFSLWLDAEENSSYTEYGEPSTTTFFHEVAHGLLHSAGMVNDDALKDFNDAINKDVDAFLDPYRRKTANIADPVKRKEEMERLILQDLADHGETRYPGVEFEGISDMIDGATNGDVNLGAGHSSYGENEQGETYWERDSTNLPNETFANIYSAEMRNDTAEIEYYKEHFPNVYEEYKKLVEEANNMG